MAGASEAIGERANQAPCIPVPKCYYPFAGRYSRARRAKKRRIHMPTAESKQAVAPTSIMAAPPPSTAWPLVWVAVAIAAAALTAIHWDTVGAIVDRWSTGTYSHGFLVLPATVYLIWERRRLLAPVAPRPNFLVLLLLVAIGSVWLLGHLTATDVLLQLSVVGMLITLIWGFVGTPAARVLLFPLSFLLFAVPVGGGLIPLLQDISAWSAVWLLELSGVPVLLEGRFISVPYGRWEVAEVCSGIRALIACLAMGYLYAGLMFRNWTRRIAFVVASAVVPIVANGVRIYGIVLLGYLTGNQTAVAADHVLAGWVFTSMVMVLLLALGHLWREKTPAADESRGRDGGVSVPTKPMPRVVLFGALALVAVGLAPASASLMWQRLDRPLTTVAPVVATPWQPSAKTLGWAPQFSMPYTQSLQTYTAGDYTVGFYVARYLPNDRRAKLVSSANQLYDRVRWSRVREGEVSIEWQGQRLRAQETVIRAGATDLTLWSWYGVDGRYTSNGVMAKWLLARARLLGRDQPPTAFVVATPVPANTTDAAAALTDFLSRVSLPVR